MNITIYSTATGQIQRVVSCPDEMADQQFVDGEAYIEGRWPDDRYYIDAGQPSQLPSRPTEHHRFDWPTKAWIDPRTLEDLKAAAWERIKQSRDAAETAPLIVDGRTFDAGPESVVRVIGAVVSALADPQWSDTWTLADNTRIVVTASDILAVGRALAAQTSGAHRRGRLLRAQIEIATTLEALDAIQWAD